jgi:hypothetical protein
MKQSIDLFLHSYHGAYYSPQYDSPFICSDFVWKFFPTIIEKKDLPKDIKLTIAFDGEKLEGGIELQIRWSREYSCLEYSYPHLDPDDPCYAVWYDTHTAMESWIENFKERSFEPQTIYVKIEERLI